jgi:hypothetical protein
MASSAGIHIGIAIRAPSMANNHFLKMAGFCLEDIKHLATILASFLNVLILHIGGIHRVAG